MCDTKIKVIVSVIISGLLLIGLYGLNCIHTFLECDRSTLPIAVYFFD